MKLLLGIILIFTIRSEACWWGTAESTVYYTPDAKKMCGRYGLKCPAFVDAVEMQGSGKLYANKVLRHTGEVQEIRGACPTTTGAAGICLIPYISVAADANYYNIGDIISMPAMKGKKLKAPDGSEVIHPGYFIVHDSGGAIDGKNRFDFYTGPMDLYDENNSFGYKGQKDMSMHHADGCEDRKKFKRITSKDKNYANLKKELIKFDEEMRKKVNDFTVNIKAKESTKVKQDTTIKTIYKYIKEKVMN